MLKNQKREQERETNKLNREKISSMLRKIKNKDNIDKIESDDKNLNNIFGRKWEGKERKGEGKNRTKKKGRTRKKE